MADRLIIRNHYTVAVIDQSPLRFYAALPLVQFLRPLGVAVCDKNHKIGKPCTNYKHPRKKHRKQQEKPPLLVRKKMHPALTSEILEEILPYLGIYPEGEINYHIDLPVNDPNTDLSGIQEGDIIDPNGGTSPDPAAPAE